MLLQFIEDLIMDNIKLNTKIMELKQLEQHYIITQMDIIVWKLLDESLISLINLCNDKENFKNFIAFP